MAKPDKDIKQRVVEESLQWHKPSGLDAIRSCSDFSCCLTKFFHQEQWVFRGEPELFARPFAPTIYRDNFKFTDNLYPNKQITDQEVEQVQSCRNQVSEGSINDRYLSAFMPAMHPHDVNWLPRTRHFGLKTRFLDVTSNPLVALFFACYRPQCDSADSELDSFVYAFMKGNFRPVSRGNFLQKSTFPQIPIDFHDLFDVDLPSQKFGDEQVYIFEPFIPQERLNAQAGLFLFWRKREPILHRVCQLIPLRIDGASRTKIISQLSAFGITKETLFPDE